MSHDSQPVVEDYLRKKVEVEEVEQRSLRRQLESMSISISAASATDDLNPFEDTGALILLALLVQKYNY